MIKNWIAVAGIVLLAACQGADSGDDNNLAKGSLKITGEITGLDTGYLELMYPLASDNKLDTVEVKKGKFSYTTDLAEPVQMLLRIAGTRGEELAFFADPGKVTIKANKDSLWTGEVKAGKSQEIYTKGEEGMKAISKKAEALYQQYMEAQGKQDVAAMQQVEMAFNDIQTEAREYAKTYSIANRGSIVAAYYTLVYLNEPEKETELMQMYDTLTPAVQKSFFGTKIGEVVSASAKTAVGAMAPDFTQNDVNGNPVSLSSFRGKYVLLDFWAAWCKPCRQENPNVVLAYNTFNSKGFDVLGVSLDQTQEDWVKAIADDKLVWQQVSDLKYWENSAAQLYGIRSIPASFLLDKEGKIIAKNLRGEELQAKLKELMP